MSMNEMQTAGSSAQCLVAAVHAVRWLEASLAGGTTPKSTLGQSPFHLSITGRSLCNMFLILTREACLHHNSLPSVLMFTEALAMGLIPCH